MTQLTATKVRSITKPGRHGDGAGLYLNVTASGSKSWVQRIVIDGRRRDIGLGDTRLLVWPMPEAWRLATRPP